MDSQISYEDQIGFLKNIKKLTTVAQIKQFPYNCIGLLKFNTVNGLQVIGTAFLISSHLALTVAHNIFNRNDNTYFLDHTFYPGICGFYHDYESVDGYQVSSYRFLEGFKQLADEGSKQCDYALLKLNKPIYRQQYCQLGINYIQEDQQIGIFGYSQKSVQHYWAKQQGLWSADQHTIENKVFLKHNLSTYKGNSGSPIFAKRDNRQIVFAIHLGGNSLGNFNVGRLVTDDLIENILKWEKEMSTSEISINVLAANQAITPIAAETWLEEQLELKKGKYRETIKRLQKQLAWDLSMPYADMFSIQGKMAQLMSDSFYQITSCPLPSTGTININLKVVKYGRNNSGVDFGIITESRKDKKDNTGSIESVRYATNNFNQKGSITMDTKTIEQQDESLFLNTNTSLILSINLDSLLLSFTNTGNGRICTVSLSPLFKNKTLYLFAQMWNKGDCVVFNRMDHP